MKQFEQLSRAEMKKVMGGIIVPPVADGCSVSCSSGYFACCNGTGKDSRCVCVPDGTGTGSVCGSGGAGSTTCSAAGTD